MTVQRVVALYVQRTAAPIKKGSNLYTIEGTKIVTYVVTGVGPTNTKVQLGKEPDPTKQDGELLVPDPRAPGQFLTKRRSGGQTWFYSSLEEAREQLFLGSLDALEARMHDWGSVRKLKIPTLLKMAEDWGIPVDESLLKANPV